MLLKSLLSVLIVICYTEQGVTLRSSYYLLAFLRKTETVKGQKTEVRRCIYKNVRMNSTVKNSHMYSFELFKYVSVGQSARSHKKKKEGLLRHRSGSHLYAKWLVGSCSVCSA